MNDAGADDAFAAARGAVERLRGAGFETYLAGGCVRDRLLGRTPKDYDVATSARPEQVEGLFRRTIAVGKAFGVVRAFFRGHWFEVATFRSDGAYVDGRRPVEVRYSTPAEDAARRDFTVNGMFLDPTDLRVVDFVGGREDLAKRLIRAIGDPEARFAEDSLRLLRAVRFAAKEGFEIEGPTRAALERRAESLRGVAPERMREELLKLSFASAEGREEGAKLLFETGLMKGIFGPLVSGLDGARAATVVGRCPSPGLPTFLAGLFGGAIPPDAPVPIGRAFAERVALALRLSNEESALFGPLVAERGRARGLLRARKSRVRLWATRADLAAHRELLEAEGGAEAPLAAIRSSIEAFGPTRPEPWIDGTELMALGVPRGPTLGRFLRRLRALQLSNALPDKSAAIAYARRRATAGPPA